ncbi:uncharacterized protein LOC108984234 isoform X2 [Juglans regia]|uniref:Uncharacterized protein LOC108984234 isoform X2 n=1 Tax=Juglans regia TaxID=51240 RepID=A0A6P9E2T5_JUGRE|nr:uncharacterized protein LOC108984234 isoform X2 [Juglans regia]
MEGFHSMKRKQLQALCKKHGVPANLTNREMADKLTLLLEEEGEPINKGPSCSKDLGEIGSANDSKIVNKNVKKVKFSPDNETFIFVGSESDSDSDKDYTMVKKRAGKRRSTVKLLSKKQVQVVDSVREIGVSGKNIDRQVRITRSRAQVVGGDAAPLVGKKRPRIGTIVESMEVNDVGFSDKPPVDAVSVDSVAGVMKSQAIGRRGRRKTRNSRRNDGVVLLDDVSDDNVEEGAKQKKMSKPSRSNVTKEKGSSTLSTKMGEIGAVGRITRSRTQLDAKASAVDSRANTVEVQVEREEVLQLEEPLKGLGSKGLKKKSVGPQKARVKIDILAMEGPEPGKVLRRSKRNAAIDEDSEPSIRDLGKTKVRTRRAEAQIVEKASAVDNESESFADQKECEDGVRGPGRDANKQDLVVPQKGKLVSKGPLLRKETKKRLRNAGVEGNTGANPTVEPTKEHEKLSLPHGRPRRSNRNSLMLTTSAHMVGDMRNRETAGRVKQARESLQGENLYAVEEPLSNLNASRNDSIFISNADGARKVGRMKRRREPNPKGKGSVIESESSIEKSPRHSTHDVLKSDFVAAIEGPSPIVDTGSAVQDTVDHRINPDSSCIKEISGKSMGKQKGSTRKSSAKKGLRFLEVSAVTSDLGEVIDTTTTVKEKVVPTPVELKGISTDQCAHNSVTELEVFNEKENILLGDVEGKLPLNYISEGNMDDEPCQLNSRVNIADVDSVKLEPLNIQSKVGSVVSSGNASPADCLLPLYQSYYNGEAANLSEMKRRRLETEEPLTGENMNLRSDKQDGQSDGDDQTSVQEDQHQQDANIIDKLIIHEIVVEDHPSQLREIRCSNRKFKHTSERGQEISALDLFEGEEIDQVEIVAGVTEIEQTISEANLLNTETGEGKHGHSDIAATPLRPALESQAISKEVIANYLGTSSPKKDALEEEENQPGAQSIAQSTILERSNKNHVGEEKYSSYRIEVPNETICIGETSESNAVEKIRTELEMTNENNNEETLHSGEGVRPTSNKEPLDRGSEQNLRIDGCCLRNLDSGVGQSAEEKENDVSDYSFDTSFVETYVTCLHELSAVGRITPTVPQEMDTCTVENTSTSIVGLKCPASSAKEDIAPSKPTSLKDNDEQEGGENMNLRNDKQDDQSDGDDQTSVQEDQNLQDANEIDKTIIHEFVIEDHLSELREIICSDRKSKYTSDSAEEISALDLFKGEEIDQVEILAGVTEIEQTISEANLLIAETGKGKHAHSDTAAVPLGPALESRDALSGISNEVMANYLRTSSPKKDAPGEEENQSGAQSTAQSTTLERGNTNHAGEEKYSSYGIETPEERICMGETPVSNAAEKMGTELGMTNESKNESLHSGRAVPTSGEELFGRVFEQNLRIDGGCLPILDGGVSQGAEKKESDLSDENVDFCFDETKVTFLHEFSSRGKITPIVQQETDTGRVENTSTSIVGLKCPASAKEDSSPSEPTSLKGNDEQEGEGNHLKDPLLLSHNGRNAIESGVALLHKAEDSVLTTFKVDAAEEKTEARSAQTDSNDENPNDAAKDVIEPSSLLHFSLEESQGGNKSESEEVNNILDELLSPNIVGVRSAERSAEEKVTSGFDGTKLFPLEALNAVSRQELFLEKVFDDEVGVIHRNSNVKALDDMLSSKNYMGSKDIFYAEGQKRELFAEQRDHVDMKEYSECSQQVELGDHRGGEVVGLVSQSPDSTSGDPCDNFAKGEVGESAHDDDSCGISAAVPDEAAHTVTMEKMGIVEAKLVGSLLTVSPVEQKKPYYGSGDEVLKIDASAVCTSNEVLPKDSEGIEETSSGVVLTSFQLDEVRFGNLDNQILEVSPELDGSFSIGLDVLVSMDDKPADRVENFETVAADEADAECSGRKNDSEKVGDGAKLFEEALVSPHLFDCSSKWEEKEAENINSFADTSCGKYEIHPSGVIVSISSVSSSHGDEDGFDSFVEGNSYDTEGKEMADDGRGDNEVSPEERVGAQKNDGPVDGNVENSATAPQELAGDQVDGQNGAVTHADLNGIDFLTFNEPLRRSSVDKTEEGLGFNRLAKMGIDSASSEGPGYAEFENSHVVTSEKSEVAVNHVVLPTVIALPSFATRALDSNDDSCAFTTWELNLLLGGSEEDEVEKSGGVDSVANLLSTTSEDTEEVSMNVAIAEDQHGTHEQHMVEDVAQMVGSCLAVSDEPISENDNESKKQGEVFAITQEHAGCENDEHQFIKVGISSSSIDTEIPDAADLDVSNRVTAEETMAECGHNDSKQVQNNADVGGTKFSVGRDGSEHRVEAMEIDVPKIDATIEELSPASTNMVVGREIDAEFVQTPQSKLESPKLKEKASLSVKQLNSSVVKGTMFKASLIPRTPKNLNMKENVGSSKNDQIGNTTAARTMPKRRPLEDLQNN